MPIAIHDEVEPLVAQPPSSDFPPLEHFRIPDIPPAAYYIPDFITPEEEDYISRKLAESPQPKWKTVGTGRRLQYWGGTMSKNGTLLPEPLPDWLTQFPDIIKRIEGFLDDYTGTGEDALGINQVLVNEYAPGQGISPHEDGPAFRSLVATVSLGSHTILDIHHYLSTTSPSPPMIATPTADGDQGPRAIAAIPLAHILVMPRSLLVLSSSLYSSHLHGISTRTSDVVVATAVGDTSNVGVDGVQIANAGQLGDATVLDALRDEGRWSAERGTRTSLTFRHAEKVLKGGALSMVQGKMRRF